LRELFVDWGAGGFVEVEGEPSTPALGTRLDDEGVVLGNGARAEICLELDGWFAGVARGLAEGVVLVVDYGYPAAELYAPTRAGGTLRAYSGHRVHDDWAVAVGRQDLTAHVDFSAVDRAAAAAGLDRLGQASQAEFLVGLGLDELLETIRSDPGTTLEAWLATRSAVRRLLDPRATGGFRVAMFGRGIDAEPALRGLGYQLAR
jgi:SAM-dependent MidA family methyltransferase